MGSSVSRYAVLIQIALLMLRRHETFCDKVASRYRTELGLQHACDVDHRGLNLVNHRRPLALQPLLYVFLRLCDQLLDKAPRDVLAQTEMLCEDGIGLGACYHVQNDRL